VALTPAGVLAMDGARFHRLGVADGLACDCVLEVHRVGPTGEEIWATYPAGRSAGATRLFPSPAITLGVKEGLLDARVARVVGPASGVLCFSYDPLLDLGLSVRTGGAWKHFNAVNSPLRSGRIKRIAADARGGVWIQYAKGRMGVARLFGGKMVCYDVTTTQLPYNTVDMIMPEPRGLGIKGDQVWFVTVDGLTRFDLGTGEWKHYGRKHSEATDVMRLLGIDTFLTDAILDIKAVACAPDSVWISTPRRLHRYDGESFKPLDASFVSGLNTLRFDGIASAGEEPVVYLRDLNNRRVMALAAYNLQAGWKFVEFRKLRLPETETVGLSGDGREVWAFSPEWGARAAVYDSSRREFTVRNLLPQ